MCVALPPFVNGFDVCMPPETRCVRALCLKRVAMAIVWLGQEGGSSGGGEGQPQRARVLYGLSEGHEQMMTTRFTCALIGVRGGARAA